MNVPIEPKTLEEYEYHYNIAAGIAAFVYWFRKDYGGPVWIVKHEAPNRRQRRAARSASRKMLRRLRKAGASSTHEAMTSLTGAPAGSADTEPNTPISS